MTLQYTGLHTECADTLRRQVGGCIHAAARLEARHIRAGHLSAATARRSRAPLHWVDYCKFIFQFWDTAQRLIVVLDLTVDIGWYSAPTPYPAHCTRVPRPAASTISLSPPEPPNILRQRWEAKVVCGHTISGANLLSITAISTPVFGTLAAQTIQLHRDPPSHGQRTPL